MLAGQIFKVKAILTDQLIGGLYNNFVLMDQASIRTTIPVSTRVPARFHLPLETDTTVTLTQDIKINAATVSLTTGGLVIYNAPTDIILPAGTDLPVHLSLLVPVDQEIPVDLNVAVDIPLNQTELHQPFIGLQEVLNPYYDLLKALPGSWEEALCGPNPGKFCQGLVPYASHPVHRRKRMNDAIRRLTLPNGLTIQLKEIHTAPIISHWVWYRVGSRDEVPGLTGISHWVEHMQFKGTPQFPAGILDKAIALALPQRWQRQYRRR